LRDGLFRVTSDGIGQPGAAARRTVVPNDGGQFSESFDFVDFDNGTRCNRVVLDWTGPSNGQGFFPLISLVEPPVGNVTINSVADVRLCIGVGRPADLLIGDSSPYEVDLVFAFGGPDPDL